MRETDFNKLVERRFTECLALMREKKGPEYARQGDRLSNFKRAAELQDVQPETALLGMWAKHLVSIIDLIYDIEHGDDIVLAQFREKVTDSINYHVLLEALVEERLGIEQPFNRCKCKYEPGQGIKVDDLENPVCKTCGGGLL